MRETAQQIAESSKETDRKIAESSQETDRKIAESSKETDRKIAESSQETDRKLQETAQQMRETDRKIAESSQETDRKIAESSQETDRKLQETAQQMRETDRKLQETAQQMRETDRKIAELSKNIGGLSGSLGRLIESMFSAKLWELFTGLGYEFTQGCRDQKFRERKRVIAEVDIFLENGEYAMPVEIKTALSQEDVEEHLERIEKIRGYLDAKGDRRRLVGAVAGGSAGEDACRYAHKNGLYVLVQSGDAVALAELPPGFKPKTW